MKRFVIAAVTFVLTLPTFSQTNKAEQEILKLNHQYEQAHLKMDIAFFEKVLDNDYIISYETGTKENKKEYLQVLRSEKAKPTYKLLSMRSEDAKVRLMGNTAVLTGAWLATTAALQSDAEPVHSKGLFTSVFEWRNGQWFIIAEHMSKAPPDKKVMEQEVHNIISAHDKAILNGDLNFFHKTYADDFTYTSAAGVDDKKTSLAWFKKNLKDTPTFKLLSMKSDSLRVRVVGNAAIAYQAWISSIEGTKKNPYPPYISRGYSTFVLEKSNGKWKIVSEHDTEALRDRKLMEQQVLKAGREYNELMKRLKSGKPYEELVKSGDMAALDRVLADEYIYTSRDGVTSGKKESFEEYKKLKMSGYSANLLQQEVRIIGNNAAVETGAVHYKGINEGKPFDLTKRYTTTWVWRDGRWQIVADHTSKIEIP